MTKLIKNTLLLLTAGLLIAPSAGAQSSAAELSAYLEKVTNVVESSLSQAAEQHPKDVAAFLQLAEQIAGEGIDGSIAAVDIRAALYCNQCDASATSRLYAVRLKDIIFPPTTGPTFPQDAVAALNELNQSVKADTRLNEEERSRQLAVGSGLVRFITMLQNVHDKNPEYFDTYSSSTTNALAKADPGTKCTSWWCRWGKCAAAIVGGAASVGLTGAIGGSAVPGIGTVAGGVIGAIGGGLNAAVATCN
jgi:hypothetical protein